MASLFRENERMFPGMRTIRTLSGLLQASFFLQAATASERPTSDPYTGDLAIFEYPERDARLQINRVMDLLKIKSGTQVADIGAGSGWFTVRAARRVGPRGSVFAVEINPDYVHYVKRRAMRRVYPTFAPFWVSQMIRCFLTRAWTPSSS